MGKKAKFKAIRRLAAVMPELKTIQRTGVTMTGRQVLETGTTEVGGEPVAPTGIYRGFKNKTVPMNHERNMKKLYYRYGEKGVRAYIQNVENHVKPKHDREGDT